MVPALRPGLDQHALDGGGATAERDPPGSVRLQPFSLRSTDRRQDARSRGRGSDSPYRDVRPSEHGCAAMCRYPPPVPVCPGAWTAPEQGKPLACGICHVPCLLPVLPVPRRRRRFPPCQVSPVSPFTGER